MPAVVSYWQLAADEKEFLDFLQGTGTILALPSRWVETKEELTPQSIVSFIEQYDPNQLQFGLAKHVLQIKIEEHEPQDGLRFGVPVMEPCVIGYRRGQLRSGKLALSNLSAYWDYPSEDKSKLLKKDQEFVTWAKKVMAWARRATSERLECNGYPYRATKRVRDAVCQGKLEVVLY